MSAAPSRRAWDQPLPKVPEYRHREQVPQIMLTTTQIKRRNRRLKRDAVPAATYRSDLGGTTPLYLIADTEAVPRKLRERDWSARFVERYTTREEVHLAAAHALWELNRFSKHHACPPALRHKLYYLKSQVIQRFWEAGYCVKAQMAYAPALTHTCTWCGGKNSEQCIDCKGTGLYVSGGTAYWSLTFEMGEEVFRWHQPARYAPWAEVVGEEGALDREAVVSEIKPVTLNRKKQSEAVALLEWVLSQYAIL